MNTLNSHPTSEVNKKAIHILFQQMGVVDTFKFFNQFTLGSDDYTQERKKWLDNLTLDEIVTDIKAHRK